MGDSVFAKIKKNPPKPISDGGATIATQNMVNALKEGFKAKEKEKEEEDDAETASYVNSHIKLLSGDNPNAEWIFETSVDSIKTVFKGDKPGDQGNIIKTLKQTACVFVAETHYGNLPKRYDDCDQTNIGQIRPPAYKAIFNACPKVPYTDKQLSFLGAGTNCRTLHPYEMPLCCSAIKPGEKTNGCERYRNNPLICISKEKRDLLEKSEAMTATDPSLVNWDEGLADPIKCYSTSGSVYYRIPAMPKHSVFASIFYLKLVGFDPMNDNKFTFFGAKRYNGASASEQRGYQRKLNTCLKILDKPENTKIIENSYRHVMDKRSQK
jgi:hypothetical protein